MQINPLIVYNCSVYTLKGCGTTSEACPVNALTRSPSITNVLAVANKKAVFHCDYGSQSQCVPPEYNNVSESSDLEV
jgi:hypothetical protein